MPATHGSVMRFAEADGGTGAGPSESVRSLITQLSTDDLRALLIELRSRRHEESAYLHALAGMVAEEIAFRAQ
jgi:hypothetical protein